MASKAICDLTSLLSGRTFLFLQKCAYFYPSCYHVFLQLAFYISLSPLRKEFCKDRESALLILMSTVTKHSIWFITGFHLVLLLLMLLKQCRLHGLLPPSRAFLNKSPGLPYRYNPAHTQKIGKEKEKGKIQQNLTYLDTCIYTYKVVHPQLYMYRLAVETVNRWLEPIV